MAAGCACSAMRGPGSSKPRGAVGMSDSQPPLLPEVRPVEPGDHLSLCTCGRSSALPDCTQACAAALQLKVDKARLLLLCRCGRSARLPYCDGSHAPPATGWRARWRRFTGRDGASR